MEFGQRVNICGKAFKARHSDEDGDTITEWQQQSFEQPVQVIVIGIRHVRSGQIKWSRDSYGEVDPYFDPFAQHRAFLVVRNMRENPFYVFPDQIISEPE